jgi:hypothetical protein
LWRKDDAGWMSDKDNIQDSGGLANMNRRADVLYLNTVISCGKAPIPFTNFHIAAILTGVHYAFLSFFICDAPC